MIFVDKLDDTDFPTFPQFQGMLREYERCYPERPTVVQELAAVIASTVRPKVQRFYDITASSQEPLAVLPVKRHVHANGLSVWPDGVTRCSHGVAIELACRACRLQCPDQLCDTEIPK